jgi:hypothetical protein
MFRLYGFIMTGVVMGGWLLILFDDVNAIACPENQSLRS